MLRPGTFGLTLLLSLLTGLGPLTMDMYLPSLPAIGQALGASTVQVQLTISSYLIGFAAGQIVYGPVSDRIGRRPVILAALVLYGVATIVCAVAQSIEILIAVRFVQALGGAGCIVLARAAVRDLYSGVRAGRELSLMGSITAFAPIVAPAIGGVLQTAFGWRASFVLLVVFALVAGAAAALLLPETLRQRASGPFSLSVMGGLYRSVLAHRGFLANLGILVASFVGLFAWIAGAPFVMQDLYGLTPVVFGMTYAAGAAGYMVGAYTASRFVMRLGLDRTIGIGAVVMAVGGFAMAAALALGGFHVRWVRRNTEIFFARHGALTPFPDRAGTASSLLGFAQQTSAAIAAAAIGHYLGRSAWPVAGTIAVMGVLALLIWALTRRVLTAPMFNA